MEMKAIHHGLRTSGNRIISNQTHQGVFRHRSPDCLGVVLLSLLRKHTLRIVLFKDVTKSMEKPARTSDKRLRFGRVLDRLVKFCKLFWYEFSILDYELHVSVPRDSSLLLLLTPSFR